MDQFRVKRDEQSTESKTPGRTNICKGAKNCLSPSSLYIPTIILIIFHTFCLISPKSSELFVLTYGSIVTQLIADYDTIDEVNNQLDQMGYNIGLRLIDEFLSQTKIVRCQTLKETAEIIAKVGLKMFLGVTANVSKWSQDEKEFSLILDENPLTEFVDLPDNYSGLLYSNMLCGVIRGALEMTQMKVVCKFISDSLRPNEEVTEIRVYLKEYLSEAAPVNDE